MAAAGEPGPVAVVIPFPLLSGGLGLRPAGAAPLPRAVRRGGLSAGSLAHLADRRRRVGIYAGLGCVDAGPVAGRGRRAAPGAGGHVGQRQGVHPRRPPPGRRLGLRQARAPAPPRRRSRTSTSCWPSASGTARSRRPITRSPSHDTLIHVDANPQNLGRNVPTHVCVCADARVFLDRLLADGAAIRRPPCPALWQEIQQVAAGRPLRGR